MDRRKFIKTSFLAGLTAAVTPSILQAKPAPKLPEKPKTTSFKERGENKEVNVYYGDRNPEGIIPQGPGDLYFRDVGKDRLMYVSSGHSNWDRISNADN